MRCACCGVGPLWAGRVRQGAGAPNRLRHAGRRLCTGCHDRAGRDGTLLDWPRVTRPGVELVAEAELLRVRWPRPWHLIAAELGVAPATLERARTRATRQRVA